MVLAPRIPQCKGAEAASTICIRLNPGGVSEACETLQHFLRVWGLGAREKPPTKPQTTLPVSLEAHAAGGEPFVR